MCSRNWRIWAESRYEKPQCQIWVLTRASEKPYPELGRWDTLLQSPELFFSDQEQHTQNDLSLLHLSLFPTLSPWWRYTLLSPVSDILQKHSVLMFPASQSPSSDSSTSSTQGCKALRSLPSLESVFRWKSSPLACKRGREGSHFQVLHLSWRREEKRKMAYLLRVHSVPGPGL